MILDHFKEPVHASLKLVKIFLENNDLVTLELRFVALALHYGDIEFALSVLFEIQEVGSVLICARYLDRVNFATLAHHLRLPANSRRVKV
jgi:hypothetical protein